MMKGLWAAFSKSDQDFICTEVHVSQRKRRQVEKNLESIGKFSLKEQRKLQAD